MPASIRWKRLSALPLAALVAVAMTFALVLVQASPADAGSQRRENQVDNAMNIVRNQKGDPYNYGSAGPNRFDCSGLFYYSFRKAGIDVPRTSGALYQKARPISKSNMRRGDLMFFYGGGGIYHVAVFAGRKNGRTYLVHASRPGTDVKRDPVWTSSWKAGTLRSRG